ncbi:MAG TPA: carboxypeptidase-like regulatory domain-containing protein, partial [Bryobacteraceae bacterium]
MATLTGIVTDPANAVVAGATIRATHIDTGTVLTAVSSATGNYNITQMPIGRYTITLEVPGFKIYRREGLTLSAAQILALEIALEVGTANEAVTVTGEASLLKTEEATIAQNVTVSQMQNLPLLPVNGATGAIAAFGFRDPYGLARLLPGVQYTANSVMVINGKNTATTQYRIEGQ